MIPPHPTRKCRANFGKTSYGDRNRIERLVSRLKHFRRIVTRCDRRAAYFLATIHLTASLEWMN